MANQLTRRETRISKAPMRRRLTQGVSTPKVNPARPFSFSLDFRTPQDVATIFVRNRRRLFRAQVRELR
jgi:hypothetical protein